MKVQALKKHPYGVPPKQYDIGDVYELDEKDEVLIHAGVVRRVEGPEVTTRDLKPTNPKKYQRRDMKAR